MTEASLCAAFSEIAERCGWEVYPEVAGWDLVLVSRGTVADGHGQAAPRLAAGYQVAVEAKLRPGLAALASAANRCRFYDGREDVPHAAAVLVPEASWEFRVVAAACGLHAYDLDPKRLSRRSDIVDAPASRWDGCGLVLPPVKLQSPGGQPSPRVLSRWRLGAMRLCDMLALNGSLVREDFRRHGIEPQRWLNAKWIVRDGTGKAARYVVAENMSFNGPCVGYEAERVALRIHEGRA